MHKLEGSRLAAATLLLVAVTLASTAASMVFAGHRTGLGVSLGLFAAWAAMLGLLMATTPVEAPSAAPVRTGRRSAASGR